MGVPQGTIRRWIEYIDSGKLRRCPGGYMHRDTFYPVEQEQESIAVAAAKMETSKVRAELSRMNPQVDPEELWKASEMVNDQLIERKRRQSLFDVTLPPDSEWVGVAFISDQHIAIGEPTDLTRMREDAELIAQTPNLYCMLGGDGVDNHCKHRSAVLNSKSRPHEQWILYNHYLGILRDKILVMISGNHDDWTVDIGGVDVCAMLAQHNKLMYAPSEAFITLHFGSQAYRVLLRHKYRYSSSFNQTHSVKRMFEMHDYDFDIGVVCHHHEMSIEPFKKHGLMRWAIRPGSYKLSDGYSRSMGFVQSDVYSPTILLNARSRLIECHPDVRQAVGVLEARRNGYGIPRLQEEEASKTEKEEEG